MIIYLYDQPLADKDLDGGVEVSDVLDGVTCPHKVSLGLATPHTPHAYNQTGWKDGRTHARKNNAIEMEFLILGSAEGNLHPQPPI